MSGGKFIETVAVHGSIEKLTNLMHHFMAQILLPMELASRRDSGLSEGRAYALTIIEDDWS
ncbi:hypothetical protein D9V34_14290 [Mycetocola lacteus]|uniref:Uncharacterized protein n=1 Tax=Mycetocola lacteus TaxID=76637 RepID=A0A3L7AKX9_9MICO|nr:hypothetical protein D9V34_14290 [Mycetocola lacteus]